MALDFVTNPSDNRHCNSIPKSIATNALVFWNPKAIFDSLKASILSRCHISHFDLGG
jgi:hypothetical protein